MYICICSRQISGRSWRCGAQTRAQHVSTRFREVLPPMIATAARGWRFTLCRSANGLFFSSVGGPSPCVTEFPVSDKSDRQLRRVSTQVYSAKRFLHTYLSRTQVYSDLFREPFRSDSCLSRTQVYSDLFREPFRSDSCLSRTLLRKAQGNEGVRRGRELTDNRQPSPSWPVCAAASVSAPPHHPSPPNAV